MASLRSGNECLVAASRGVDWLLARQRFDGSWTRIATQPVDAYYKGSWSLALAGRVTAAERLLGYAKLRLLQPDGDFAPRDHHWHRDVHYLYANAYLVIGAHKIGRFDISCPALAFVQSQQDPRHGGFHSVKTAPNVAARCDTMSTGAAGLACAMAGDWQGSEKAAANLEQMIQLQPAPKHRFLTTLEADGAIGAEFPPDEAFWRVVETQKADQCWYAIGLPFCLAVVLWDATGDTRFRKLADWYFDFQSRCVNPWDGGSSGKAGWGCSVLYRITGESRYREIALRVASRIAGWQHANGGWFFGARSAFAADGSPNPTPSDIDVTSEFALWLQLIGENLLARDDC